MKTMMTTELYWLALSAMFLLICWLPYVSNRSIVRGFQRALGNPRSDDKPVADWADRAKRAHMNGVENLVVFASLIIVVHLAKMSTSTTAYAAQLYFWSRLAHFVVFTAGIPYARTLAFFVSWLATAMVALTILGVM